MMMMNVNLKKIVTENKLIQQMNAVRKRLYSHVKLYWQKSAAAELNEPLSPDTKNPYVAARQEWNLMYGDLIKAKYNWQRIAFLVSAFNIMLLGGFVYLSSQSRFIPYAVKVDALGNSAFAGFLDKSPALNPLEVNAFIRRYMTNVRSVIADPVAEKQALAFVYATSSEKTAKVLNEYYRQNSPFKIAAQSTIEIQINSAMQKSDKTWQIGWTEIQRGLDGNRLGQTHWEALVTVTHLPVTDAHDININPLGIFIEQLSWSQQL